MVYTDSLVGPQKDLEVRMDMDSTGRQTATGDMNKLIERRYGEGPGERLDYIKGGFMGAPGAFHIDEISWGSCDRRLM